MTEPSQLTLTDLIVAVLAWFYCDRAEVDFAVSDGMELTDLIEYKAADGNLHPTLKRFAQPWPNAKAIQIVGDLRQPQTREGIDIV